MDIWTRLFADRRLLSLEDHLALEEPIVDVIRRDSIDLSVPARVYADFYAPKRTELVLEKALIDRGWDIIFRSEEHTSELQSLMRISYAVFCLKKNNLKKISTTN